MYWLLCEDELIEFGLYVKNLRFRKSINDYIENGFDEGFELKYIVCCKILGGLNNFCKLSKVRVVKIMIEDELKCIDLMDNII